MGRRRIVSPEFFLHERLAKVSHTARLLFVSLWCQADRDGRLRNLPMLIHAEAFPHEPEIDLSACLAELEAGGFLLRYTASDRAFLAIPSWQRWQNPHRNERASSCPAPPSNNGSGLCTEGLATMGEQVSPMSDSVTLSVSSSIPGSIEGGKDAVKHPRAYQLAEALREAIRTHSPEYVMKYDKPGQLTGWAVDIDRLLRLDNADPDAVEAVIQWAHVNDQSGFWQPNLLSGKKVRKHFPKLRLQSNHTDKTSTAVRPWLDAHFRFAQRFYERRHGTANWTTAALRRAATDEGVPIPSASQAAAALDWLVKRNQKGGAPCR